MSGDPRDESSESNPSPDGSGTDGERHCVNCGASVTRYSTFCSECGTEQRPAREDTDQRTGRQQDSEWPQERNWPADERQDSEWPQERNWPADERQDSDRPRQNRQQSGSGRGGGQSGGQQRGSRGQHREGGQSYYTDRTDRTQTAGPDSSTGLAALTHVSAMFFGLLGPIAVYVITDDPFVKENAAHATNWQIMLLVYGAVLGALVFLLFFISLPLAVLAMLLFAVLALVNLVFIILAASRAADGVVWEYPLTPELL